MTQIALTFHLGLWAAPFAAPLRKTKIAFSLGHFQVGSYRSRSLIEGLYTL